MLNFESDYNNGAHPEILKHLCDTNLTLESGYGFDCYTESAKSKIRDELEIPDADIYLLVGGTQTNRTVISSVLKPFQGVVSADSGHVAVHEAGAIEASGHKVFLLPSHEGKLNAAELDDYMTVFNNDGNHDHMPAPGMVYISFPTEYGTLYSKKELEELYSVCTKWNIPLYVDGARLAYGIMSRQNDVSLKELAHLCDVFYIGGTKVGALCGEAVVFTKHNTPDHFFTLVKQNGALLAKGRLLGVQYEALFTDGLFYRVGEHAIEMAEKLKEILRNAGLQFYLETPTNQQFVIIDNGKLKELQKQVAVSFWDRYSADQTVIRFCTSWYTTEESLLELEAVLNELK